MDIYNKKKTDKTEEKNKSLRARGIGGFMSGVLVLSISTVIVKIIGLAVKIPLLSILGAEGMGYFNSAYEIYALLCVISTAGLPTALSMLVSANRERAELGTVGRVYKAALLTFVLLGGVGSGAMLIFARQISAAIGNREAYYCILAIAPALLLVCISSAVRGYFQGLGYMTPTALSQLIEAFGKLIFGVSFGVAAVRLGMDLPRAAAMSTLGLTVGMLISCLYLLVRKKQSSLQGEHTAKEGAAWSDIIKKLLYIAFPITLSSAVISSCRIVDMALILRRLQDTGMSVSEANEIYGAYTTLAVPVFGLVPSLITPISLSLIPALSAAVAGKRTDLQSEVTDRAIRLTVLLSMPSSMGIALYARPILTLLFHGEEEAIGIAAPLLSVLGISVMFSGLITTSNAILQSYGRTVVPIISMGVGTVFKVILAYFLMGIPQIGALGAPISTIVCDITVTAINLYFIGRCSAGGDHASGFGGIFTRPLAASLLAMGVSAAVYYGVMSLTDSMRVSFLTALPVAVVTYCVLIFAVRAINKKDIEDIPLLNKILLRKK